jgi:transcriptional regulator with XRE-family HTH domain
MGGSMTPLYKRILEKKKEAGLTWDEICKAAQIRLGSWMTGLPTSKPTDEELKRLAVVLNTSVAYLKTGKEL